MKFIQTDLAHIEQAKGLVVVIDVLRAFSTACYAFHNNAYTILPVETVEEALELHKKHSDYLLLGERHGKPIEGFAYTNSPAQIKSVDFSDRTIIMTTSQGTKGIMRATHADEVITGSFVNSSAIVDYVNHKLPSTVSFVCTDASYPDNEDYMCASYIQHALEHTPMDFDKIIAHLRNHPCTDGFLKHPLTEYSREDFALCMQVNTFPFVIQAKKIDGMLHLVKL
jgi:2-phosphosulfolactate phosphatase